MNLIMLCEKKQISKVCILHDSINIVFLKWQNNEDGKQTSGDQWLEMSQKGGKGLVMDGTRGWNYSVSWIVATKIYTCSKIAEN